MQIAHSKTRDQFPLSERKIWKKTIAAIFMWIVILLVVAGLPMLEAAMMPTGVAAQRLPYISLAALAILIVVFIITYCYQYWYFKVYYYDLGDDFVVVRKGPIAPREITIPWERIQDIYVDQDIWDRMFGLYDVHLSSATFASGMEAHIDGVGKDAADGLKALLLQTVRQKIGRKQKQNATS